jgi:hypothetical protein
LVILKGFGDKMSASAWTGVVRRLFPYFVLFALPILLFYQHIFGEATWIGNPDRLNNFLKVLKFYVENQLQGSANAWNDYEMMGYNTYGLPTMAPSIITYFTGYLCRIFGIQFLYVIAGYVSIALLILCGVTAYWFLVSLLKNKKASLVGAACYELSILSILNMSQNDSSAAVLIAMPLMAMIVRNLTIKNASVSLIYFFVVIFFMINFMFLQTVSYVLLFSGLYVLYRSVKLKEPWFLLVFCLAALIAIAANFPRLAAISSDFFEYERKIQTVYGSSLNDFDGVYRFSAKPVEILRWFDNVIFGHTPSESLRFNQVNWSEGMLLYSSSLVPFLILYVSIYYKGKFLKLERDGQFDGAFFFWFLAAVLAFVFVKPLVYLLYLFYFKISFFHSRIITVALLCVSVLMAYALVDLEKRYVGHLRIKNSALKNAVAFFVSVFVVFIIEFLSKSQDGIISVGGINILAESLTRIGLSAALFLCLLFLISSTVVRHNFIKYISFSCLCVVIVIQAFLIDYVQINNSHNFSNGIEFSMGNFYYAKRDEFLLPKDKEREFLHRSLENEKYRTIVICDMRKVDGLCSGHFPEFWKVRAADGYYGLGVPKRIRMLPWLENYSIRTIRFFNIDHLPWELLRLLTVKYVIEMTPELYKNVPFDKNNPLSVFKDIRYIKNPNPVLPRAFFAESIKPAADSQAALASIFVDHKLQDVRKSSAVEGIVSEKTYSTKGNPAVYGKGDRLEIHVEPSEKERFLVLNDLFFPGWSATANGKSLAIYPTNVFARGVILPAFADRVIFQYTSLFASAKAWIYYAAGAVCALLAALLVRRR